MVEADVPTAAPSVFAFREPMSSSPLWLDYSGLPAWVNEKVGRDAWLVLRKVVELDCACNARPGTVEIAPAEIAQWCGLAPSLVMRLLEGLRRKKCLALFLPEHPEEQALVSLKVPLPTPLDADTVRESFPFNHLDPGVRFRYAPAGTPSAGDKSSPAAGDRKLQRLLDRYFSVVGFKMNTFILDELRLIAERFDPADVEKTFDRAGKNDIRSLGWIVRELYRLSRKHDRTKK